ncbi:MAG: hypothetical protein AB7O59_21945 [Pirellulales bacterium]
MDVMKIADDGPRLLAADLESLRYGRGPETSTATLRGDAIRNAAWEDGMNRLPPAAPATASAMVAPGSLRLDGMITGGGGMPIWIVSVGGGNLQFWRAPLVSYLVFEPIHALGYPSQGPSGGPVASPQTVRPQSAPPAASLVSGVSNTSSSAAPPSNGGLASLSGDGAGSVAYFASHLLASFDSAAIAASGTLSSAQSAARGSLLPAPGTSSAQNFEFRHDGTHDVYDDGGRTLLAPREDREGGLIELDVPEEATVGPAEEADGDGTPAVPKRNRRSQDLANRPDQWSDLRDALEEFSRQQMLLEHDAAARETRARHDKHSNTAGATFDEGGAIELAAGGSATPVAAAVAEALPPLAIDVTMDAGVALFQAFELSSELPPAEMALPVAPIVPQADAAPAPKSASEETPADAEADSQGPHRAALGAGLIAAVPISLARWRARQQTHERAKSGAPDEDA